MKRREEREWKGERDKWNGHKIEGRKIEEQIERKREVELEMSKERERERCLTLRGIIPRSSMIKARWSCTAPTEFQACSRSSQQ